MKDLGYVNVSFVPGYLGFFLLGHYIHEYGLGKWHRPLVWAAVPALLLSGALTVLLSRAAGQYVHTLMLETNPLLAAAAAGIFAFFKGPADRPRQYDPDAPLTRAAVWTGGRSFGIYLVQLAVLDGLAHWPGLDVASYPSVLSVPLNALLIFALSLGIAAALKKSPGCGGS